MRDTPAEIGNLQIILHNDDETPWDFVVDLVRSVFGRSEADAKSLTTMVAQQAKAECGIYPPTVADAILVTAQERIKEAGHPLLITIAPLGNDDSEGKPHCAFCGNIADEQQTLFRGQEALICDACLLMGANHLSEASRNKKFKYAYEATGWHFAGLSHEDIVTTSRQFPGHMRADVQVALDKLFSVSPIRFFGLYEQHRYETLTYAALTKDGQHAVTISAAQYQDVDIGEGEPTKCLNNGLWLNREGDMRYAVVLSFHREYGQEAGTCIEIAVPAGEEGVGFVQRCFAELASFIHRAFVVPRWTATKPLDSRKDLVSKQIACASPPDSPPCLKLPPSFPACHRLRASRSQSRWTRAISRRTAGFWHCGRSSGGSASPR